MKTTYIPTVEQKGYDEMFALGKLLRHRYDGYLNPVYDVNQILVKANDGDRFLQSAMALNEGLFPSNHTQSIGPRNLVPVHSICKQETNNVSKH